MGRQADMCCYLFYRCRAQRQLNLKEKKKKWRGEGGAGTEGRSELTYSISVCCVCAPTYICTYISTKPTNQPILYEKNNVFFLVVECGSKKVSHTTQTETIGDRRGRGGVYVMYGGGIQ